MEGSEAVVKHLNKRTRATVGEAVTSVTTWVVSSLEVGGMRTGAFSVGQRTALNPFRSLSY
jgi:hypothetical protein